MNGALTAAAALSGAVFTGAACWALGILLLNQLEISLPGLERVPLAFVTGAAALHALIFGLMATHVGYRVVLIAVLAAVIPGGVISEYRARATVRNQIRRDRADLSPALFPRIAGGLIFAAYAVLYFVNAWAPEVSPDGSGYHLELVARYLRAHGFEAATTNMYAGLSEGVEMLFVPAFAIGKHSSAALVHFWFAAALALLIFAYGVRLGKERVGAVAALLVFLCPVVGIDGSSAYVDVATTAVAFAVFYWLEIWDQRRDPALLIPIGLLGGYCYAAKYTAAVMLLYAIVFIGWRARSLKPVLIVTACAAVMIVPWMVKDWVYLHDPIAPFGSSIFRNPNMFPILEEEWIRSMRDYGIQNLWTLPVEVTVRGVATQGLLGPVFWLAPLSLLAFRRREGRRVLIPGLLFLAIFPTNVGTRFLIPCLPFFSLGIAMFLDSVPVLLVLVVAFHAVASWPTVVNRWAPPMAWRIRSFPLRAALRKVPEERYERLTGPGFELARLIDQYVPPGEPVLTLSGIPSAYTSREVVVSFQSAYGMILKDIIETAWNPLWQPTRILDFRFEKHAVQQVRLLQTAKLDYPQDWGIVEVQFLDQGVERRRDPGWRVRAFPDPWNADEALDDSLLTRWRSWEPPWPGMYLEIEFGHEERIDEVKMRASQYALDSQVELQSWESGRWVRLGGAPKLTEVDSPDGLRRGVGRELSARGMHYLLVQDFDDEAKPIQADPESWGFAVVARGPGGTIYRMIP